jgi:hypothetical protein
MSARAAAPGVTMAGVTMAALTTALRASALLSAASLAGCGGAFTPYATLPSVATAGQPAGTRVAICYNGIETSHDAAQEAAQKECPAGTRAERVDKDYYLQFCPLLLPARATFACVPDKK